LAPSGRFAENRALDLNIYEQRFSAKKKKGKGEAEKVLPVPLCDTFFHFCCTFNMFASEPFFSLLFRLLTLDLSLKCLNPSLQLGMLLLQVVIVSTQHVNVGVRGCAQALLDEINRVCGLLRLLIESNQHLGQLVYHS
jgi:hypothetical protein